MPSPPPNASQDLPKLDAMSTATVRRHFPWSSEMNDSGRYSPPPSAKLKL